jgi:HEPN domain-containing protein
MGKESDHIKKARKDLELARKYRSKGDIAVATLLYNKAISAVMRSLYLKRTGRHAPPDASLEYMSSRASLPDEVEEYVRSVMEPETMEEELESMEVKDTYAGGGGRLLYLDGLIKRLLDYANAY